MIQISCQQGYFIPIKSMIEFYLYYTGSYFIKKQRRAKWKDSSLHQNFTNRQFIGDAVKHALRALAGLHSCCYTRQSTPEIYQQHKKGYVIFLTALAIRR